MPTKKELAEQIAPSAQEAEAPKAAEEGAQPELEEVDVVATAEPEPQQSETPNYDAWKAGLLNKYGNDLTDEDLYLKAKKGYDEERAFGNKMREENARFAEAVQANPDLAAFWKDVAERGKDGHPELALKHMSNLLKDYIEGNIDEDEYVAKKEGLAKAEAERKARSLAQDEAYKNWAESRGYDPEEWMQKANDALFSKMAEQQLTDAEFDALDKMLNYDKDVADANEAGQVAGRNEQIATRRASENSGDGLIHPTSAPKQISEGKGNSGLDFSALAARRSYGRPK